MYFASTNIAYIRLLMLIECKDLNLIISAMVAFMLSWMRGGALKHSVKSVLTPMLIITAYLMIVCHINACLIQLQEDNLNIQLLNIGSGVDSTYRYISTFYMLITTQTSVGYGDILINHTTDSDVSGRYLYQIMLMLTSIMFNGIYYGLLILLIEQQKAAQNKATEEAENFEAWLSVIFRSLPRDPTLNKLFRLMYNYFKFTCYCSLGKVINSQSYIGQISYKYAQDVQEMTSHGLRDKFGSFFSLLDQKLSIDLVQAMKPLM